MPQLWNRNTQRNSSCPAVNQKVVNARKLINFSFVVAVLATQGTPNAAHQLAESRGSVNVIVVPRPDSLTA